MGLILDQINQSKIFKHLHITNTDMRPVQGDGDLLPRVTPASLISERIHGTVINSVSSSSAASSKLSTYTA